MVHMCNGILPSHRKNEIMPFVPTWMELEIISRSYLEKDILSMCVLVASVQFSSVSQLCPTPCDPMDCSNPGHPVHHQLLESTQAHVHRVSYAIQPSHPLLSPSPPAPNPSQHQGLFK